MAFLIDPRTNTAGMFSNPTVINSALLGSNAFNFGNNSFAPIANIVGQGVAGIGANSQSFNLTNALKSLLGSDALDWKGLFNTGIKGISDIANIIGGFEQLDQSQDALDFSKYAYMRNRAAADQNFNNKVYAMRDAYRRAGEARYSQEGLSGQQLTDAVNQRQQNISNIKTI